MEREIKLLLFLRNFCKVFSIAFGIACWVCVLLVDADLNFARVVIALIVCMLAGFTLLQCYSYLDYKLTNHELPLSDEQKDF